jgi:hypothetical protein
MIVRKFIATVTLVVLAASFGMAQTSPEITATWTAPTEGTPAVRYEVEVSGSDGSQFSVFSNNTEHIFAPGTFEIGVEYIARVRAFDAQDRVGPWSVPSDPYVWDPGPPGSCGPIVWSEN